MNKTNENVGESWFPDVPIHKIYENLVILDEVSAGLNMPKYGQLCTALLHEHAMRLDGGECESHCAVTFLINELALIYKLLKSEGDGCHVGTH